jgi:hypothetical protein
MKRDILGLSGADAQIHNHSDADLTTAVTAEDEQARRRKRMSEGADEVTSSPNSSSAPRNNSGAAGIDMGAGGNGTGIE